MSFWYNLSRLLKNFFITNYYHRMIIPDLNKKIIKSWKNIYLVEIKKNIIKIIY